MAGGKLSPRQKMINMMYLVLTALLAMNVSAEVLNAFDILRENLVSAAITADNQSVGVGNTIKAQVKKEMEAGQAKNAGIIDSLDIIHADGQKVIDFIDEVSAGLRSAVGVNPDGSVTNPSETEKNIQFLMGAGDAGEANNRRGSAKAKELKDKMNAYFTKITEWHNMPVNLGVDSTGKPFPPIKADSLLLKDPTKLNSHGEKTVWERYNFEGPVAANLAMLEALKSDVYAKEQYLYADFMARLGLKQKEIKLPPPAKSIEPPKPVGGDAVTAIIAPVSTVVVTGMPFKAKVYVGLIQKNTQPSFSINSGTIVATPDKDMPGATYGDLTIPTSANALSGDKKEATMEYSGKVSVKGGDATFKGKYIIRKPEIVITSATIQNLYRECGNAVKIDVPALGDMYNPQVTVNNGEIVPSKEDKKKFMIVPGGGKTCVVTVNNAINGQNMKIGDVQYNVVDPPKPSIVLRINGQIANGQTPLAKGSRVTVQVVPDPEFKTLLPMDARYSVSNVDIYAALSLGAPTRIGGKDLSGQDATQGLDLPLPPQATASPGTKVFYEIKDVVRKNFRNKQVEDKRFSLYEKSISVFSK